MCGIAGYVDARGDPPAGLLRDMLAVLEHRGPDDCRAHEALGAGLGTARLAIIDVAGGQQPVPNEEGTLWAVCNGEIYNHRALRAELEGQGHRFRSRSDTEVLVHLFEEAGEACVDRLRGMFAFAVWDGPRRRLFLARDRLGKKPLYYWHREGLFLFASEIKALLCHPGVSRVVDGDAFHHYLAFGYTPAARSIFAQVAKLPPGHTATLDAGRLATRRYWALPAGDAPSRVGRSRAELADRVRHLVRDAVAARLESDVPLGVFLSGGIDSSIVVAAMREATSARIRTFSVGFGEAPAGFDELPIARAVARRFDTDHHEEVVRPRVADLLPLIAYHLDEPFADSSVVPTFVVAQAAARHVKVALSGIGGDETFGGYPRYLGLRLSQAYGRVPGPVRAAVAGLTPRLLRDSEASRNWPDRARRFLAGADAPPADRYIGWTRLFGQPELERLATRDLRQLWTDDVARDRREAFQAAASPDLLDGAFRVDLTTYLPDDLLVMADRMGMAHSLEVRAPFCDHLVVAESLAIDPRDKIPGLRLKGLLRAAFAGVLPREVLAHRKQGFMIPVARWLRTDLREMVEELLAPEAIRRRRLFEPDEVARLKREHLGGARSHADRLWTLMMAELWIRRYLDGASAWSLG